MTDFEQIENELRTERKVLFNRCRFDMDLTLEERRYLNGQIDGLWTAIEKIQEARMEQE